MNSLISKPFSHFLPYSSPRPRLLFLSFFSSSPFSSLPRRHDEESRNVRVSVWWDFENCNIPAGVNVFKVAHFITAAVRAHGIKGPVEITAFGDVLQLSRSNQEALSSTGINLTHIPRGGKNSADRSLLVDLMYWVSQNPPPAHLFLITGDRDFAGTLHRLRMNNYNVLLASPESSPGVLCSAASIMWHWNALVKGENLTGRHFNQPPDGPFNSWYGHSRLPLEDPYLVAELPSCSKADDSSRPEMTLDSYARPVPKAVIRQIHRIVSSYPKGLSITDLRAELGKNDVSIDKDFYGYKKFSLLLKSLRHILKVKPLNDGQYCVRAVSPKFPEHVESSTGISGGSMTDGEGEISTSKANFQVQSITNMADMKAPLPSPHHEADVKQKRVEEFPSKKTDDNRVSKEHAFPVVELPAKKEKDEHVTDEYSSQTTGTGFLQRIWTKWFRRSNDSERATYDIPNESHVSGGIPEKSSSEERPAGSTNPNAATYSSSRTQAKAEATSDKPKTNPGLLSKIIHWCKFWRDDSHAKISGQQFSAQLNETSNSNSELFLKDTFWNSIESFLKTYKASEIVLNSRTREEIAQKLSKEGPLDIRSLEQSDLLHLVDLLISDKKWIKEGPAGALIPFRVVLSPGTGSSSAHHRGSNGLSTIFSGSSFGSHVEKLPEQSEEKKSQNVPHSGISSVISKNPSDKSRGQILCDCEKLVDEILEQHPEGYDINSFRKLFRDRYGYPLNPQKLGYLEMTSLLQVMPGVRIDSTNTVPARMAREDPSPESFSFRDRSAGSDGELSETSRKDDNFESAWDELGPVANPNLSKEEPKSDLGRADDGYESSLSDDEFSDPDEDGSPSMTEPDSRSKARMNEQDSSLLQILDSWYCRKDESNRKDLSDNIDGSVDCSKERSKPPATVPMNYARKQRPSRNYTFVSDTAENKDKLIDGILGSLKKSGKSKMQS